jgi:hypothetical protein
MKAKIEISSFLAGNVPGKTPREVPWGIVRSDDGRVAVVKLGFVPAENLQGEINKLLSSIVDEK